MKKLILFFCLVSLCLPELQSQTFLPFGSTWSYYEQTNEPPSDSQFRGWENPDYDASSWSTGPAQLGYGDNDEATTIPSNLLAAYFRKDSIMINPGSTPSFDINLLFDDGAVVYLNGNEVGRVNMAVGNPGYFTLANAQATDNEITTFSVPASAFINGYNVIAVEVHQRTISSSDISFDLEISAPPPITRGPYLQNLTSSSVVVKWRTSYPTESIIRYGLSLGTILASVSDLTPKTEHEIEITGLTAGAKYFYQVEDNSGIIDGPEPEMYFKIAPVIGSTPVIKAWVLGDPGTANNDQRAVRDAYYNYIGTDHTDVMLFLGDNAYNSGTDEQYQYAMFEDMYEDRMKNTASWSCLGNHDGFTANSSTQSGPYYDIFTFPTNGEAGGEPSGTEAYYSFDYGNIHFIVLESYETDRSVGGPMYNWVLSDIQNTTQEWIVAIWHHPAYTKGSHNSDNNNDSAGSMRDMRENFLPILEDNGVDLVMSGHSHSYERSYFINGHYGNSTTFDHNIHSIPINGDGDGQATGTGEYEKDICLPGSVYITTGSAGKITGNGSLDHAAMYYSAKSLGSVVIEVDGARMDLKFVRENGNVDDFFTIEKGAFGSACDDGDPCTYNDVFDALCNCAGVLQPIDTDMDGTDDCMDDCPNDPLKIVPGICGCGVDDTSDVDGDLVVDCIDGCPTDPAKSEPGDCGCGVAETDSDFDGTPDCVDLCPTDPGKIVAGVCGCGVADTDSDFDGTPDCDDLCPTDPGKIVAGVCGCGVADDDTDFDGTLDCNDLCPTDPGKIIPGDCGCGVSDVDTDGDLVADCNDGCPADPLKASPGICGCGVADVDTDNDSTPDCDDLCPNDPLKTAPGFCGCGLAEGDSDNDGTPDCTDGCPNDPLKTSPGICGCLKVDVDNNMDGICDLPCLTNLFVNLFGNTNTIYEVSNLITSNAVLSNSNYVEFSAGNAIQLNPNFEVKAGASLHAYILGCTN